MTVTLITQTTNPAKDFYRYLHNIVAYRDPAALVQHEDRGAYASVLSLEGHIDVGVGYFHKGKPVLRLGHFFRVFANGDFTVNIQIRRGRYWKSERDLLARHTFIQWAYVSGGRIAVYTQDHKRVGSCGDYYAQRLNETNYTRRRPYMELDNDLLFNPYLRYRLYKVGDRDWKVRAVGMNPEKDLRVDRVRRLVKDANLVLDRRYADAEARYQRAQRRDEMEAWRTSGGKSKPLIIERRDEIVRTFIDHAIVFEPKIHPQWQPALPFTDKEVVTHGR